MSIYNISDYIHTVSDFDFQRNNRFSMIFASSPLTSAGNILQNIAGTGSIFNGAPLGWNLLGNNPINDILNSSISYGFNKLMNQTGLRKVFIGAMNNRLVESILGQFPVGQAFINFFSVDMMDKGLWIESATPPATAVDHEMDFSYKSPSINIKGRNYETFNTRFRMDSLGKNFMAFVEWNQAILDPIKGLQAFLDEISVDIQLNFHDRNGIPHTTSVFHGCIPVSVKESQSWDYELNDTIQTFDVVFAYRSMFTGKVSMEKALEWLASRGLDSLIGKAGLNTIDPKFLHSGQQTFNIFGTYKK